MAQYRIIKALLAQAKADKEKALASFELLTDKAELFECDIKIEGASLSNSTARLVVETSEYSLMFNGKINSSGKCEIPIRKLKGLIDESSTGNIRLEVIAEDTNNQETINELLEDYPAAAIEEFIEYFGEGSIDSFTDAYQGQMSGAEFAEQITTDCYCLDIPAFVCVDWEATWNELSHDYVDLGGYIFCCNF